MLAALTGLIVLVTKRTSPRSRYNMLTAALLLFVVTAAATFCYHLAQPLVAAAQPSATAMHAASGMEAIAGTAIGGNTIEKGSWVQGLVDLCNRNANNIVLLWIVVVGIRSLQLIAGLNGLRRLRRTADFSIAPAWAGFIAGLKRKAGVRQAIRLAESAAVKVPMVMGHFKPLILVPMGLMAALPVDELEAILLHEIAHIRRKDYLVNLLQRIAENIFFFNPAIWWLSSLIRTEREHCCDDITLTQVNSKKHYINALVSCQEYVLDAPAYAVALNGGKNNLLQRVKRMVSSRNASLNLMEKSLLSVCLVLSILLIVALSANPAKGKSQRIQDPALEAPVTSSVTSYNNRTEATATVSESANPEEHPVAAISPSPSPAPVPYPYPMAAATVSEDALPVDAVPNAAVPMDAVPAPAVAEPQSDQEKARRAAEEAQKEAEIARQNAEKARVRADETRRQAEEIARRNAEHARLQADADRRRAEETARRDADRARLQAEENRRRAVETARRNTERARQQAEDARQSAEDARRRAEDQARIQRDEARRQVDEARRQADRARQQADQNRRQQGSVTDVLINEMLKDGLIRKQDTRTKFKLNEKELVVNGVKQPQQVFVKYRDQYMKAAGKTSGSGSWNVTYKRTTD